MPHFFTLQENESFVEKINNINVTITVNFKQPVFYYRNNQLSFLLIYVFRDNMSLSLSYRVNKLNLKLIRKIEPAGF